MSKNQINIKDWILRDVKSGNVFGVFLVICMMLIVGSCTVNVVYCDWAECDKKPGISIDISNEE